MMRAWQSWTDGHWPTWLPFFFLGLGIGVIIGYELVAAICPRGLTISEAFDIVLQPWPWWVRWALFVVFALIFSVGGVILAHHLFLSSRVVINPDLD